MSIYLRWASVKVHSGRETYLYLGNIAKASASSVSAPIMMCLALAPRWWLCFGRLQNVWGESPSIASLHVIWDNMMDCLPVIPSFGLPVASVRNCGRGCVAHTCIPVTWEAKLFASWLSTVGAGWEFLPPDPEWQPCATPARIPRDLRIVSKTLPQVASVRYWVPVMRKVTNTFFNLNFVRCSGGVALQ